MPVPERLTVCGLLDAPSLMVSVPVRVPVWLGVKMTPMTHFAEGASDMPLHASLEREKSPADGVTLLISSGEAFGFVMVTFLGAEVVSTSCLGNVSVSGLMLILVVAYAGAAPKPANIATVAIAIVTNPAERASSEVRLNLVSSQVIIAPLRDIA